MVTAGNGSGVFEKYDDGWRLSEVQSQDDAASPLSPAEQSTLAKLTRDDQNDYMKKVAESKTPTKVLLKFDYCDSARCAAVRSGEVTDVGVSAGRSLLYANGPRFEAINVGFGELPDYGPTQRIFAVNSYGFVHVGDYEVYLKTGADAQRLAMVSQDALTTWRAKFGIIRSLER